MTGSPGSGGTGGTGAGGAGASMTDAGICVLGPDAPRLWARGLDPQGLSFDYDGAAFVANSTTDALNLTISVPPDAGAGSTTVQIGGIPMPLFPAGARVWLTKSKDATQWFGPVSPSSFAVRDGQGGPLLFGGATGGYGPLSFPVKVDQLVVTCTQRDQGCAPNSTISFAGATVSGDNSAFVDSNHLGTILLGGAPYEVRVYAADEFVVQPVMCTDFFGISEVQVDIRSTNLASLIAGLPTPVQVDTR
ncbi:MAG: hypothetical protein ACJ8F1_22535 [Polyangia bacterium]